VDVGLHLDRTGICDAFTGRGALDLEDAAGNGCIRVTTFACQKLADPGEQDVDPAFELERVGLGGAGVDAADVIDGAGGE
jgi:hypothetical protein